MNDVSIINNGKPLVNLDPRRCLMVKYNHTNPTKNNFF